MVKIWFFSVFWDDLEGVDTLYPPHSSCIQKSAVLGLSDLAHLISWHSHSADEAKGRSLQNHQ